MKAKHYFVSGIVQGVGYRYFVNRVARNLGINGYVKNLWDGRVEVFAEAEETLLHQLEEKLRIGPSGADVDNVEVIDENIHGYQDFQITF
jgi:acylphosphatase